MEDTNKKGFVDTSGIVVAGETIDGRGYAEALKLSLVDNVVIENCEFFGGYEDCIDIMRGHYITIRGCKFHIYGDRAITIKGGSSNVLVENCEFICHNKKMKEGIRLGDYDDYSSYKRKSTINITLKNLKFDCKHDQVFQLDCKRLRTFGGIKVRKLPRWMVNVYFSMRRIQDRLQYGSEFGKHDPAWVKRDR